MPASGCGGAVKRVDNFLRDQNHKTQRKNENEKERGKTGPCQFIQLFFSKLISHFVSFVVALSEN